MGFLFDDIFIVLTDANEKPEAANRELVFMRTAITAFYRKEVDQQYTNLFTSDGRAYTVKESVEQIKEMLS